MPNIPFISIVTVTYNNLEGLILTSMSIASQIYKDFEWIVIDGGSADGTQAFIAESDILITKWICEKDQGIYDAMNKGIKLSTGKYTIFLNAGDVFFDNNTLISVYRHISENKSSPDMVLGGATFLLPNGVSLYKAPRDIGKYIWHGVPSNHQSTYFNNDLLKNNLYDIQYKICGDYYLMARIFLQGHNFTYLNIPLVKFDVGGTSYTNPLRLCMESYLIKKRVLNLPFRTRIRSLMKSIISTFGLILLSQSCFRWLANYIKNILGVPQV